MKEEFKPDYYFSQEAMQRYGELFNVENIWEVLPRIKDYLEKTLEGITEPIIPKSTKVGKYIDISGKVKIGENCEIGSFVTIEGPVVIGDATKILPGTYIRGYAIIGNKCVVRTELKNVIIMDGSHVAHLGYLGDSILGERVNLGAETVSSNFPMSESTIKISYNNEKIDSGLLKLGVIMGDDSGTGSISDTSPGTLVGKRTYLYPGIVARGFYPSDKIVKVRQQIEVVERR